MQTKRFTNSMSYTVERFITIGERKKDEYEIV